MQVKFVKNARNALIVLALMSIVPVVIGVPCVWVWDTATSASFVGIVQLCVLMMTAIFVNPVLVRPVIAVANVLFVHLIYFVIIVDFAGIVLINLFVKAVIIATIVQRFVKDARTVVINVVKSVQYAKNVKIALA